MARRRLSITLSARNVPCGNSRRPTKLFKVTDLFFNLVTKRHSIYMVAADGETWKVAVDCINDWPDIYRTGITLEVSMVLVAEGPQADRSLVPDWTTFGAEGERIVLTHPAKVVSRNFGEEVAARHFPSDEPVRKWIPVDIPEQEAPAPRRKRRSRKANIPKDGPANNDAQK